VDTACFAPPRPRDLAVVCYQPTGRFCTPRCSEPGGYRFLALALSVVHVDWIRKRVS
jgi:hypothetical protein